MSISTHAPYTEGDSKMTADDYQQILFQLTPPIQRATGIPLESIAYEIFQLTPPIQRATDSIQRQPKGDSISTHAPYTEGDCTASFLSRLSVYFNSRPLYRGRRTMNINTKRLQ